MPVSGGLIESGSISRELAGLFTEHGSRGTLAYWGTQLATISADRLNFLGRWVPGSSVEDLRFKELKS